MASALTPANITLGTMKTEVANYVKLPGTTKGLNLAEDKIQNAIRRFNMRPWAFLLTKEDITLSASTRSYAMTATDIRKPRSAQLLETGDKPSKVFLKFLPPLAFVDVEDATVSDGEPEAYTFFNPNDDKTLTLDISPSSAFVGLYPKLRLRYYRAAQFPANDAAYMEIPSHAEAFILWWAKYEMALDEDPQKAEIARREAQLVWDQLIDDEGDFGDGYEEVDWWA